MNIQELTPGVYKIILREDMAEGSRAIRSSGRRKAHLLRVSGTGSQRRYFIDHDPFGSHPDKIEYLEDYEVIRRYVGSPSIQKARITITFADEDNDTFSFTLGDAWVLRNLFESIPWLKKPFGYSPRKKDTSAK